jgi:hypothetical protein
LLKELLRKQEILKKALITESLTLPPRKA